MDELPPEDEALSGILHYFRYEHGRRYFGPVPAVDCLGGTETEIICCPQSLSLMCLANDSKCEAIRLENQHRLCYTILSCNLYLSEIELPPTARILDIGTSSGIWAIEMAGKFPQGKVIGLDISPQQTGQSVPQNCSFVVPPSRDPADVAP